MGKIIKHLAEHEKIDEQPTLLIGIGGIGTKTITKLKEEMMERIRCQESPNLAINCIIENDDTENGKNDNVDKEDNEQA